ncbi:ectonucleoside triphosphate diphosphohydrolase 8 isoform B [Alligator mississippiensis]|uniref:Ectonucleoside triphosphate diphosphohydrolase 8 isoform B n=2 Tax=Alligator mississippiensis TaxID=8496 RepID=A0A151MEZ4_ALLMI|nr:ectonucleoside triphosphate diphosphohydrolase 8 isoform B [Alligator mississippiensis]
MPGSIRGVLLWRSNSFLGIMMVNVDDWTCEPLSTHLVSAERDQELEQQRRLQLERVIKGFPRSLQLDTPAVCGRLRKEKTRFSALLRKDEGYILEMAVALKHLTYAILVAVVVFSSIALILSLVRISNVFLPPKNKYGMVFDAGSSHTSLFIYQWESDKENNTGVVSQTLSCDVEGPGISSYANDPPKAGESLRKCLDEAMKTIPAERQSEVPAYLGATAGMRLLRQKNKLAADQVLNEVAKTMQQYPVNFRGARIITGEEEGAYGWITVNYLLDSFIKYAPKQRDWIHPHSAKILGALDLGGASAQISFIPSDSITDTTKAYKFSLYGFGYTIYTHSYLCYGQNEALKQVVQKLIKDTSAKNASHPCYPKGYETTISTASFLVSPCTAAHESFPPEAPRNVTLFGTGNATECLRVVRQIFNFSACGQGQTCGFNGVYQPPVNGQFFAFSAFYYTFSFLNLTSGQSLATVTNTIQEFCARNWTYLLSSYPKERENWLRDYCGNANYILVLLLDAYKFSETNWKNIMFQMKAANTDIGWTLGYMLNLTNMIPAETMEQVKGHSQDTWIAAIFFIILTLAICIVALAIFFCS